MRTNELDLEIHKIHRGEGLEVIAIPRVFRRAKDNCINILLVYHFGLITLFRVDLNILGVEKVEIALKPGSVW